jgi:YebC/PmpR family DNA-binding regulatory protein
MSGHSKWSKVKHQKAVTDVRKAASFTKASHAISIAVSEGGGITDPDQNFHLRLAVEKAREVNMPKENIDRIIAKASGGGVGQLENALYEAYGPGGIAILIEAATDNKQRTVSAVKNTLEHHGGNLVTQGAVSFMFERTGILVIKKTVSFDKMLEAALESGADDVTETSDFFEVYAPVGRLNLVKQALVSVNLEIDNMEIIMKPKTQTEISSEQTILLDSLIEQLEDLDDVQRVYTNNSA